MANGYGDDFTSLSPGLTYIAESQGQIGLVSLMASLSVPTATATVEYTTKSPFEVHMTMKGADDSSREYVLKLPSQVALGQTGCATVASDHISMRLRGPASRPAPPTLNHLPRTYLSAAHLQAQSPTHLSCSHCRTPILATFPASTTYTALPSEHWEELIDSWMCHSDQLLNASVTRGKEGLEDGSRMKVGEVRVADAYILCPDSMIVEGAVVSSGGPNQQQVSHRNSPPFHDTKPHSSDSQESRRRSPTDGSYRYYESNIQRLPRIALHGAEILRLFFAVQRRGRCSSRLTEHLCSRGSFWILRVTVGSHTRAGRMRMPY